MSRYRVMFARRTYAEAYVDVDAESKDDALRRASALDDDQLTDVPESYRVTVEPTGDVQEIGEEIDGEEF